MVDKPIEEGEYWVEIEMTNGTDQKEYMQEESLKIYVEQPKKFAHLWQFLVLAQPEKDSQLIWLNNNKLCVALELIIL